MYLTTMRRRNDGLQNLRRLSSALDEAFGNWPLAQGLEGAITSAWVPACDIFEDQDGVKLVMEVPGVNPDDLKIPQCLETADEAVALVRELHATWQSQQRTGA